MQFRWIYTGCDTHDERVLDAHWQELQPALEARIDSLETPADDAVFVAAHDPDSTPPWEVQAVITFPSRVCVADARGRKAKQALEQCVHRLLEQLEREEDDPAPVPLPRRRRRGLESLVPYLEQARHQERMDVFAGFLQPVLTSLRGHAARELALWEAEENLPAGQWEVAELLDETLLLAWRHFDQRPRSVALDAWLLGLVGQVLATTSEEAHESLSEDAPPAPRRPVDEGVSEDQWVEQAEAADELTLADLLPGEPALSAEEEIAPAFREMGIHRLLGQLPREHRQALLLASVQGLEVEEIAAIQHTSPSEVEAMIQAARNEIVRLINQEQLWPEQQDILEQQHPDLHRRIPRRA